MFELLEKASNIVADTVTLPVSVVADFATIGGAMTGRVEPYSIAKMRRIATESNDLIKAMAE